MLTLLMFPDFTSSLASWNAKKPAETPSRDDPGRHIVAKLITVQLLASCFTSPQNINTLSLQSGRYHRQHHTNDKGQELRLVRYSPAHGHHARSNSAVSLWPDQDRGLAREDSLAEQVSRKRILRRKERRAMRKGIIAQLRSQGESSDDESRRHHFLPLRHRGPRKTKRTPFSQRFLPGRYGPSPVPQTSEDQVRQINILRVLRGLRQRDTGDDGHRWSLEPVSKRHPVFVQPVKEYMMQRWGIFRSRTFGESSTSAVGEDGDEDPAEQCRVGTSRESIQLSRQDQVMTLIQGSGSSLGMPSHNTKTRGFSRSTREHELSSWQCWGPTHTWRITASVDAQHSYIFIRNASMLGIKFTNLREHGRDSILSSCSPSICRTSRDTRSWTNTKQIWHYCSHTVFHC